MPRGAATASGSRTARNALTGRSASNLSNSKSDPRSGSTRSTSPETLKLSRTPIREALNRLASESFVTFKPNRGFHFRSLDIGDLLDIFELRMIVETGAFALMCERADDDGLARLSSYWAHAKLLYERGDGDEILDLDEGFHMLMAELCGNPEVVRQLEAINARIRFIRRVQIEHSPNDLFESHNRIVDAASRRAADEGANLLKAHISMTAADAQAALKEALLKLFVTDKRRTSSRKPLVGQVSPGELISSPQLTDHIEGRTSLPCRSAY